MLSHRERTRQGDDLVAAQARIAELEAELRRTSARDPLLAGVLTLPAFRAQLELDLQKASRHGQPLSLALLDIDRFRYLNLKYGFAAGDMLLAEVARVLSEGLRAYDPVARAGADEFVVLLSETDGEAARATVHRLLVALESIQIGELASVSASAGIVELREGQTADTLLAEATAAMNMARQEGGGRAFLADQAAIAQKAKGEESDANTDVVVALAQALEERDQYTGEHSESVVDLTGRIGESMALDHVEVAELRTAALLHDIGKVGVPDHILHKPGPLDESEWEIMRQHPVIGERILRAIPGMGSIARVVRHEHERWDGGGYPDGLIGEAIPVGARIILACDAYHAMTSDRPYRKAMPHRDAMSELHRNAGSQFDPNVVEALVGYLFGRRQAGQAAV